MVAIINGSSLGLINSSLNVLGQQSGTAALGRGGESIYVNATTGNLLMQRQDDVLVGRGPDIGILRTYNSQGQFDGDNNDNWRIGFYRQIIGLTGTINTVGSTVTRVDADGAELLYTYDTVSAKYINKDGSGSYDTLSYNATTTRWSWTDGNSRVTETYDWIGGAGKLLSTSDIDGNTVSYTYSGSLLTRVLDASGESTYLDYSGVNLTQVRVVKSDASTVTRTRYGYDASNRLTTVTVDLSPEDNSVADGKTYVTTYTYDGTSKRIASITQTDGSSVSFVHTLVGSSYRVTQMTQLSATGVSRVTNYAYNTTTLQTTVTDPLGNATVFSYDTQGQITNITGPAVNGVSQSITYTYNANGDVTTSTDARGFVTTYTYDASGNQTQSQDAAGNTVGRTYGSKNELLTSTVYFSPDPDGAGAGVATAPATSRFAYDANNRLRFSVSAEGRVSEFRYNSAGQRVASIGYSANLYPVAGLAVTASITEAALGTWVASAGVDKTRTMRTDTSYDFRGQVDKVTRYQSADATGAGIITNASTTQYVYDQAGNLLQTIAPKGVATTGIATDFITQYSYDGLTRQIRTVDSLGVLTLTQYDDANNKTSTTLANGLVTTKSYNKAGDLISTVQSDGATALGTSTYTYDAAGRLKRVTDATGVANYLLYDAAGRKVADMQADGSLTEYVYNANNQVVKTIQYATAVSAANRTLLINDITAGTNTVTLATIKPATNAADRTSWAIYDKANRLAKTVDELGFVTETQYNGASQVVATLRYNTALTAANRAALTIASLPSDAATTAVANANDRKTRNFFDKDGKQVATLDAAGYLTENQYDAAGRLIHSIAYATQSASAHWASGTLAQLRPIASANDIHNWVLYNAENQVIASVDGEGYLTENTYYLNGNKTQTTRYANKALIAPQSITAGTLIGDLRPGANAQDQTTSWTYTDLNQLKTETNYQGTITQFTYDNVGNLTKTDKAWGTAEVRTLQAKYDKLGRLIAELSGEGSVALAALVSPTQAQINTLWSQYGLAHAYDAAGRRVSTTDAVGNKTRFYYNTDGNLTHSVNALGEVTQSKYNALNQVTQTIAYGTRIATTTLATLNGGLVTTALTTAVTAITNAALDSKTTYSYTLRGQVASTTTAVTGTTSAYNAFSETSSTTQKINATTTVVRSYTYDKRGQLSQTVQDASGINAITSAIYDAFGRMTSSTDANGKVRSQTYDRLGQVISTLDPINAARSSSFDAFGRVLTQTDALGNITRYTYDKATRSVTITTPEGISVSTISTRLGQTQSVTDGRGNTSSYAYDKNGSLLSATTALTSTSQAYDRANRLVQTTDANGNQVVLTYDAANRVLSRTVDPISLNPTGLNLVTTYAYDAKGQLLTVTDPNTVVTQTTYDLKGQVTQVAVDPAGLNLRTQYTYDPRGKTLTVVEGVGSPEVRTTQYVYDKLGRRTSEIVDPTTTTPAYTGLNLTTSYTYDKNDNVITRTDANGNATRYAYDANNRLIYTLDALGNLQKNSYDAQNRITQTIGYATPITTTTLTAAPTVTQIQALVVLNATQDVVSNRVYDKDGRLTASVNALGAVVKYTYDGAGNVTQTQAFANKVVMSGVGAWVSGTIPSPTPDAAHDQIQRTVYDALGRATHMVDGTGAVVKQTFDGNGNVVQRTAYAKTIPTSTAATPAAIDAAVLLVADAAKDARIRRIYDKANRLIWSADGVGAVTQQIYDKNGNLTKQIQYATAIAANATFNSSAPPVVTSSSQDRITVMAYDKANRQTYTIDATGGVTQSVYDKRGNLTQRIAYATPVALPTASDGYFASVQPSLGTLPSATARITRFAYDAANRQVFALDATGAATETVYDAAGRAVQTKRYATLVNTITLSSTAIAANVRALVVANAANDRIEGRAFDAASQLVYSVDALGYVSKNTYDGVGRITATVQYAQAIASTTANTTGAIAAAVVLDAANDQTNTFGYNAASQLTSSTDALGYSESYTYDGLGNKLTFTNKKGDTWTYDYDQNQRLIQETTPQVQVTRLTQNPDGSVTPLTTTEPILNRTTYDALGQVQSRIEAYGSPEARTTSYVYDQVGHQTQTILPQVAVYNPALDNLSTNGINGSVSRTETTTTPTVTVTFNALGQAVVNQDVAGVYSYKVYDPMGRVQYEIDGEHYLTEYRYNTFGNQEQTIRYANKLSFADNRSSAFSASEVQALLQADPAADRVLTSQYNVLGQVTTVTEPQVYNYDSSASAANQYFTAGKTTQNTYNAFGQVAKLSILKNAPTNEWTDTYLYYDARGAKAAQVDALGYLTTWKYDETGDVKEQTEYAKALTAGSWTTSGYAAATATTPTTSANDALGYDRTTAYGYDRSNQKVSETKLAVEYAQISGALNVAQTVGDVTTRYGYDAVGNLISVTDALGATTRSYFDALGRVTAVAEPARTSELQGSSNLFQPITVSAQYLDVASTTSAQWAVTGSTMSGGDSPYPIPVYGWTGRSTINLKWSSLADWGSGNVRVRVDYTAQSAVGELQASAREQTLSAVDGASGTSFAWSAADGSNGWEFVMPYSINRVQVWKVVDNQEVSVYDSTGDTYQSSVVTWARPPLQNTQASLQYRAAGSTSAWKTATTASGIAIRAALYRLDLSSEPNGQYEYQLSYTRTGEANPYAKGTGVFALTGNTSVGSETVATVVETPYLDIGSTTSAQWAVTGSTMSGGDSPYPIPVYSWTGQSSINLKWSSLANWGSGNVRVRVDYTAQSAVSDLQVLAREQTISAADGASGTSFAWSAADRNNGLEFVMPYSVDRVQVWKVVDGVEVQIFNTTGDYAGSERLIVRGKTAGLTGLNIAGVGVRAATALGGGVFAVNVEDLARGTYSYTTLGTASLVGASFEVHGSQVGSGKPVVQESGQTIDFGPTTSAQWTTGVIAPGNLEWSGQNSVNLKWSSLAAWGPGNVRVRVDYAALDGWGQTQNSVREQTISAAESATGYTLAWSAPTYYNPWEFSGLSGVNRVQVWKVVDGVEVQIFDTTTDQYQRKLTISSLPATVQTVTLSYRKQGDTGAYLSKTASKLGNGWFGVSYDDIANGSYEYLLTVKDALGNAIDLTAQGGSAAGVFASTMQILRGGQSLPQATGATSTTITPLTTMLRDVYGNVVQQTRMANGAMPDASWDQISYSVYDSHGHVVRSVDALGNSTYSSYNTLGKVAKQWQPRTGVDGNAQYAATVYGYNRLGVQTSTAQIELPQVTPLSNLGIAYKQVTSQQAGPSWGDMEVVVVDYNGVPWGIFNGRMGYFPIVRNDDSGIVYSYSQLVFPDATGGSIDLRVQPIYGVGDSSDVVVSRRCFGQAWVGASNTANVAWNNLAGWDSGSARSAESSTGAAYVSATAGQTNLSATFGLNSDPATDTGYTSLDYAWEFNYDGTAIIHESGSSITGFGSYTTSDVLAVKYDGANVIYTINGVIKRTVAVGANRTFYFDSAYYHTGFKLNNIMFGGREPDSPNAGAWPPGSPPAARAITPVGTQSLQVVGNNVTYLGSAGWGGGAIRATISYNAINSSGQVQAQTRSVDVADGATSASFSWGASSTSTAGEYLRLQSVTGVKLEKNVNGQWIALSDAANTGAKLTWLSGGAGDTSTFSYRQTGATAWLTKPVAVLGNSYSVDLAGLSGTYEYQIDQVRPGQLVASKSAGTLTVAGLTSSTSVVQNITPTLVTTSTEVQYNSFGEIDRKGINGAWQEYFDYDQAGHVWRTNQKDGTNKVNLYDVQGRVTATIQSATLDLKASIYTPTAVAALTQNVVRTDTVYDALGRTVAQKLPTYTQTSALDSIAGSLFTDLSSVNVTSQQAGPSWGEMEVVVVDYNGVPWGIFNGRMGYFPIVRNDDSGIVYSYSQLVFPDATGGSMDLRVQPIYGVGDSADVVVSRRCFGQAWVGASNAVNLAWNNLSGWGNGAIRATISYNAINGSGQVQALTRSVDVADGSTSASLSWGASTTSTGAKYLRLQSVTGVKLEKNINGQWVVVNDISGTNYTGKSLHWAKPPVVGNVPVLKYKPTGSSADQWQTATIAQTGDYYIANLNNSPAGAYDYQLTYTRTSETNIYAQSTGVFTVAASNTSVAFTPATEQLQTYSPVIQQTVDRWGNVLSTTDPRNAAWATTYRYNSNNQQIVQSAPAVDVWGTNGLSTVQNPTVRSYYDKLGNQVGTMDANGNLNTYAYDAAGHMVTEHHADGGTVKHVYDGLGRKVGMRDGNDNYTEYVYDRKDQLVKQLRPIGEEIYTYDSVGNRITETNALGNTTKYWYDARHQVVRSQLPKGQNSYFAYDGLGNKVREENANGDYERWTYDNFSHLTAHTDLGGAVYSYNYDKLGALLSQFNTNGQGQNLSYTYYDNGKIRQITDNALNAQTYYEYDVAGNHSRERFVKAGVTYKDSLISYDQLGRTTSIKDTRFTETFSYDANGNRRRVQSNYFDADNIARTIDNWYLYDAMNRITLSQGVKVGDTITTGIAAINVAPGSNDVTIVGNSITYTGLGGWAKGSDVHSAQSYTGGAVVTATAGQTNLSATFGLNSDPATDTGYTSLDYAWEFGYDGTAIIHESGSSITGFGSYTTSDVLAVKYDGANVIYTINGVIKRTVAVGANRTFYFDSAYYHTGFKLNNVNFSAVVPESAPPLIVPVVTQPLQIVGNSVTYAGPVGWGVSGANSTESYTGAAFVSATAGQTNLSASFGLNSDPLRDSNYTSLDYAWEFNYDGTAIIHESGSSLTGFGTYTSSDVFAVKYDGANVIYTINGVTKRTVATTANRTFYLDSAYYHTGFKLNNILFGGRAPALPNEGAPPPGSPPAARPITPVVTQPVQIAGNSVTYEGPVGWGNGGANSTESYTGGAVVSATAGQTNLSASFGLNSDPTTDTGYTSLDYAWEFSYDGTAIIHESGSSITGFGAYTTTDVFAVKYDGTNVIYTINGVVKRTVAAGANRTFYFDSAYYQTGFKLNNILFGATTPTAISPVVTQPVQIAGNSVTYEGPVGWGNGGANSTESYTGGAVVSATAGQTNRSASFGLNSDPTTDTGYTSLDYAWEFSYDGTAIIHESGSSITGFGTYTTSDVFAVKYDGTNVIYTINGVIKRTVATTANRTFYFDSAYYSTGFKLNNIKFGPVTAPATNSSVWSPVIGASISVNGNNAVYNGPDGWGNGGDLSSQNSFVGGAAMSATVGQVNKAVMFGLNGDPKTDTSYASLDYAWYARADGIASIYQNGSYIGDFGSYKTTDVFSIVYSASTVRFMINGVVKRTDSTAGANRTFYFDSAYAHNGAQLNNIQFGPASQGVVLAYDLAGNRRKAISYESGAPVAEDYNYDGNNRLRYTARDGNTTSERVYNAAGQVLQQYTFGAPGVLSEKRVSTYDANGRLLAQDTFNASNTKTQSTTYTAYDGVGNVLNYQTAVLTGTNYTNYYAYEYAKFESYKEAKVRGTSTYFAAGNSTTEYDVNGNTVSVEDKFNANRRRDFVSDQSGQILQKTENAKKQYYFYANGKAVGSSGALSAADFDYNYTPVSDQYPGTTPGSYVVSAGDSLRSIALAVFGDAQLWYLIADANGLKTDADLKLGQNLAIPNQISNIRNDHTTNKPYAPGKIIGDTTPTLPDPPPPPVQSAGGGGGGGGCGGIGTIIMLVVIAVVTVYTAGAAMAYFAPAATTAGAVAAGTAATTMGLGASVIAGTAIGAGVTTAGMMAAAAIGAAVGSIAGQGVAMAMGMQKEFSWNQVGVSALTAGITAGVGSYFGPVTDATPWYNLAGRAALGTGISQGVGEQLGMGVKFSWTNVAMAAASSGLNSAAKAYSPFKEIKNDIFRDTMNGYATGMTMNALRGGRMTSDEVAVDAFGNALGNSIAQRLSAPSQAEVAQQSTASSGSGLTVTPAMARSFGPQYNFDDVPMPVDYSLGTGKLGGASLGVDESLGGGASGPSTVRAGDFGGSLERIARAQLGAGASQREINNYVGQLFEINGVSNARRIGPDQQIELPGANTPGATSGLTQYGRDIAVGERIKSNIAASNNNANYGNEGRYSVAPVGGGSANVGGHFETMQSMDIAGGGFTGGSEPVWVSDGPEMPYAQSVGKALHATVQIGYGALKGVVNGVPEMAVGAVKGWAYMGAGLRDGYDSLTGAPSQNYLGRAIDAGSGYSGEVWKYEGGFQRMGGYAGEIASPAAYGSVMRGGAAAVNGFGNVVSGSIESTLAPYTVAGRAMNAPATFEGTLYRAVGAGQDPLLVHSGNIGASHRYTEPGLGGLYFATGEHIVAAEFVNNGGSLAGKTIHSFENAKIPDLLDLTSPTMRNSLGVSLDDLTRTGGTQSWRYEVTQPLGTWAKQNGYGGVIAPSAQANGGVNLILFDGKGLK